MCYMYIPTGHKRIPGQLRIPCASILELPGNTYFHIKREIKRLFVYRYPQIDQMLNPLLSATFASIPIADPSAGRCLVFPTKLQPRRANRQLPRNPSTNLVIELSQAWTFILAPIQTTAHLEQAKKRYTQRARKKIFRDDPENFYFWEINPPPGFFFFEFLSASWDWWFWGRIPLLHHGNLTM